MIIQNKERGISVYDEICSAEDRLQEKIQMEIIILGCWNISTQNWKRQLKEDLALVIHRSKQDKANKLKDWINLSL
jgi:hypothetical protein